MTNFNLKYVLCFVLGIGYSAIAYAQQQPKLDDVIAQQMGKLTLQNTQLTLKLRQLSAELDACKKGKEDAPKTGKE